MATAPAGMAPDLEPPAERPDPVEQQSEARDHTREQPDRTAPDTPAVDAAAPGVADESLPAAPPATGPGGLDTAAIRRAWPDVLAKIFALKRSTWTFLSEHAQVLELDGQRLLLGISTVGLANTFRRGQHAELVRQALIDVLGVDVRVEGIPTPDPSLSAPSGEAHPSVSPENGPGGQPAAAPAERPASGGQPQRGGDGRTGGDPGGAGVVGGPRTPARESGDGGWASASAAPGSGPSWASDTPDPAGSPTAAEPTRSRLAQAREAVAAEQPEPAPEQRVADDSVASADDEDVEALGEVGRPVIERILGGTVIDEGP